MRQELEDVYENLFLDYTYDLREGMKQFYFRNYDISRLIHRQIVKEEDNYQRRNFNTNSSVRLRSDAKYFLMLIFYQMIAIPLQHPSLSDMDPELLQKYITDDITLLLADGYELKQVGNVKEVTAHTILSAIDRNWEKLNISNLKLWNR